MQFAAFWLSTLGLRHSEIIGIQFKNIFQDHIEVRRARTPHALEGNTTKTKSSVRDVPITLQTFNIISKAMYFSKKICQENDIECNADTYLIITTEAKPIPYGTLNYYFQKVSKIIDFHIFPHMMRHAFATFAIPMADSAKDVANILGHSSIAMTGYYDTGTENGAKSVIERVESKYV